ncbi:glycoside hydrolase family 26 protein [Kaistella montana]|uniref:Mannan endo-1,4-beta-mannosidase n=1 Tax=Kaistella montana TaxID=1849733 RepID=A0ABW5K7D9_9FLAO|nr:glycosyl hydrolase [Kaistella montana]MCQ4035129.1 glycoside hydrolase family 26 protein [Kaistella montana]
MKFSVIFLLMMGGFAFAQSTLADRNATPETQNLYKNLWKLLDKGFMFGHQDDLAYGVNWRMQKGRSDVKEVVGDYPAVFGWDIGGIEKDALGSIDIFTFKEQKKLIEEVYNSGGINTISWHANNPKTGKDGWNKDQVVGTVASILPGNVNHEKFKTWLDKVAKNLLSPKGKDGKNVPILFRPYHELTGSWFWWGKGNVTPKEFQELWKFTFKYLTHEKNVHNLIWVYNTSDFSTKEEFLEAYPGDEFVDMVSFDIYAMENPVKNTSFVENSKKQFKIMDEIAKEHHKIPALAETGYEEIPYNKFWTKTLIEAIGDYKISYVLAWRNHGLTQENKMHYYTPFKGHPNEQDFIDFFNLKNTLFLKDIQTLNIYK